MSVKQKKEKITVLLLQSTELKSHAELMKLNHRNSRVSHVENQQEFVAVVGVGVGTNIK